MNNKIEIFKEILKNIELYYNEFKRLKDGTYTDTENKYFSRRVTRMTTNHLDGFYIWESLIKLGSSRRVIIDCRFSELPYTDINCINCKYPYIRIVPGSSDWILQETMDENVQSLHMPCTEEQYFMYSLKCNKVLSYEDYIEFENIRNCIYKSEIDTSFIICPGGQDDIDLEQLQEIHEYLKRK